MIPTVENPDLVANLRVDYGLFLFGEKCRCRMPLPWFCSAHADCLSVDSGRMENPFICRQNARPVPVVTQGRVCELSRFYARHDHGR